MVATATLQRETFSTSRLLEFFTEKELSMQIGLPKPGWAIALLKELIDNALDACERADVPPDIDVRIEDDVVSVRDNGPGLPADTLRGSLDYSIRVSDKSHYVSPTRGQLGNALKCLWAAPYVINGDRGVVEVHVNGRAYVVTVELDRIAQRPDGRIDETDSEVKNGTLIKFGWPEIASYLDGYEYGYFYFDAKNLLNSYAASNPHATFRFSDNDGDRTWDTDAGDFKRWAPDEPTSPHWYDLGRFVSLVSAYLAKERDGGQVRSVRDFVGEFRGLSGSAKRKAVTDAANLTGRMLGDLVTGGEVDKAKASALLWAMKSESRAVNPAQLGALGEAHFQRFLLEEHLVDDPDVIEYRKVEGEVGGLPFILEVAFGMYGDEYRDDYDKSEIVALNWTPALVSPFEDLPRLLGAARVDEHDPVVVVVHLACPRLTFTDRGKSRLALPDEIGDALEKCITLVTKKWTKLKRQADKNNRLNERQLEQFRRQAKRRELTIKDASYQALEEAYMLASTDNTLPAKARQVMYQARPMVIELTGNDDPWPDTRRFTQNLLPDYMKENPETTKDWDVIFDARGHFLEPHTDKTVDLGTLEVRQYLQDWQAGDRRAIEEDIERIFTTCGPANRFRAVLFIEKEGFNELWRAVKLAERFDIGIMSTKGMSVTAARHLVEAVSDTGLPVFVMRDFDKYGFSIAHTLCNDTRRYTFTNKPNVIDLGLRLADVTALDIPPEPLIYKKQKDPRENLRVRGATPEEIEYLVRGQTPAGWRGARVELNALTSGQLVRWVESKLHAAGITKIIPDDATLTKAWREALLHRKVLEAAQKIVEESGINDVPLPAGLADRIREAIEGKAESWDAAIWRMAQEAA